MLYWWRDICINQWDKIESPEMCPRKYKQLLLHKVQNQFNGENMAFSKKDAKAIQIPNRGIWLMFYTLYKKHLKMEVHRPKCEM